MSFDRARALLSEPAALGLALARPLFAPGIALASTDPRQPFHRVLPQEAAAMARAVPSRQRAFAAGRVAARQAMCDLGLPARPIPMSADRTPAWPDDVVGSLSHSQTCCLAAVARASDVTSLGIDVEEDTPLASDLFDVICTPSDRAWIDSRPQHTQGAMAKLIFSAKEAAYKCQYPISRTLFGFDGLDLRPDPDSGTFSATFTRDVPSFPAGTSLTGSFARGNGLIVTAVTLMR